MLSVSMQLTIRFPLISIVQQSQLTIHDINKRQTTMTPAVFEPAIPANERPQTHALDRATSGIGRKVRLTEIKPQLQQKH